MIPSTESVNGVGSTDPHARTHALTKKVLTAGDHLSTVDAGAHTTDSMSRLGEILTGGQLWMTNERHKVIRAGEREPIPSHVRVAVWLRDRGKCEHCQLRVPAGKPWHLDHITPWSAGGGDDSTNLRVLCERHNLERSNLIDPTERRRRPVTWWCANCYDGGNIWEYPGGLPQCPVHRWRWCRVTHGYEYVQQQDGSLPTWHQRGAMTDPTVIAHCAHCNEPGLTDMPL